MLVQVKQPDSWQDVVRNSHWVFSVISHLRGLCWGQFVFAVLLVHIIERCERRFCWRMLLRWATLLFIQILELFCDCLNVVLQLWLTMVFVWL